MEEKVWASAACVLMSIVSITTIVRIICFIIVGYLGLDIYLYCERYSRVERGSLLTVRRRVLTRVC